MKRVTIMMAGLVGGAALVAGATPGFSHGYGDVPASVSVVSDLPLASPKRQALNAFAYAPESQQASGSSNYFYAPGAGPRCEIRMKRVQGRIYQACE
jgi:hypothetical protein